MGEAAILDLELYGHRAPPKRRAGALRRLAAALVLGAALLASLAAAMGIWDIDRLLQASGLRSAGGAAVVRLPLDELRTVSSMTVDDKAQIVIAGMAAQERNAAIALSGLPLEHPEQFRLDRAGEGTFTTALKCLTQAVYYEAAVEPLAGRRAVAQVVLNRMRHPAYPKSICGVVYQGSERRTGCQFSFTCDGALLRAPALGPWRQAEAVARAALAGYVEASVGTSTHYHADYVLPKWAFQLAKIEQLGRHIFYRFPGSWGRMGAFSGRYAGLEQIPAINVLALEQRMLADGKDLVEQAYVPGLTVAPHVTDRHAVGDVGGRLDTTKPWRLSIPDPVAASARYRELAAEAPGSETPTTGLAMADPAAVLVQP